jgi:hypothetical protein
VEDSATYALQNSGIHAKANGLINQELTHHDVIHKRCLQDLPPNEPVKPKPVEELLSPLQKIDRLAAVLRPFFFELWRTNPDQAEMAHERIMDAIKRPPQKVGRPLGKETTRALHLLDQDPDKPLCNIVKEVLGSEKAKDEHERDNLRRKVTQARNRRNKRKPKRINGSVSL